jgi:hypothetical protein
MSTKLKIKSEKRKHEHAIQNTAFSIKYQHQEAKNVQFEGCPL